MDEMRTRWNNEEDEAEVEVTWDEDEVEGRDEQIGMMKGMEGMG